MLLSDLKKVLKYFNISDEDSVSIQIIGGSSSDCINVYNGDNFVFAFFENANINFINGALTSVPTIMFTKNGELETIALNDILKAV